MKSAANVKTNKYSIAKQVLTENFKSSAYGLYNCFALWPDPYYVAYKDNGIEVRVCEHYEYVEVVGLTDKQFDRLHTWWQKECMKRGWTWVKD